MNPIQQKPHYFRIHYGSESKKLSPKLYDSIEELKKDAFSLFPQKRFNNTNAILIRLDNNKNQILLTDVPNTSNTKEYQDLFIKSVRPFCATCANPFGILKHEILLECPNVECGEQYCSECVDSIKGLPTNNRIPCLSCKKLVCPTHNQLIQRHLIWESKLLHYGIRSFDDLKMKEEIYSVQFVLTDIVIRKLHLLARLNTLKNKFQQDSERQPEDIDVINNVQQMLTGLEVLVNELTDTGNRMKGRKRHVKDILKDYKTCVDNFNSVYNELMSHYQRISSSEKLDPYMKSSREYFASNDLTKLSSKENVGAIDVILQDAAIRKRYLSVGLEGLEKLLPANCLSAESLKPLSNKIKDVTNGINKSINELNGIRSSIRAVEKCIETYFSCLSDDEYPEIPCARFVCLMEKMRMRTERVEIMNTFPTTMKLMNEWRNNHETDDEFKPKVRKLCEAIEQDVEKLILENDPTGLIPYKVGIIGHQSVGKTALLLELLNNTQYSEMVDVDRSTFCHLQFDTLSFKHPTTRRAIPITFMDIEGAIDHDEQRALGNYINSITNVDCDLFIVVHDKPFDDHNQRWLEHIENVLRRRCLLVRSKADEIFLKIYEKEARRAFQMDNYSQNSVTSTLRELRDRCSITYNEKHLDREVFLTAVNNNQFGKDFELANFDLENLKKMLVELAADDSYMQRVCELAFRVSKTIINTCFRRGYVVSKTRYQIWAAFTSIIPFLNELPVFFGREKIRQAFGIHDKATFLPWRSRTKDSLEEYLVQFEFEIPENELQSGCFGYLKKKRKNPLKTETSRYRDVVGARYSNNKPTGIEDLLHNTPAVLRPAVLGTLGTLAKVSDDIVRAAVPTATTTLWLSIAGIVVSVALAPAFAAYSYYDSGRRMDRHLHLLCDDLQGVLYYFGLSVWVRSIKKRNKP